MVDGELPLPSFRSFPGTRSSGRFSEWGTGVERFASGDRVGVPWLGWTCGECGYCRSGRENLCDRARFTGYTLDGGYAEYTVADERFCFRIPPAYDDVHAAPLLCAGLIGHRSLAAAGDATRLGLYGFGAAAHIVAQVARHQGRRVFAFTREGDVAGQAFARELGAEWAGASSEPPPEPLDAAIIFAPVGALVPPALRAVQKGGTVVCGGIHMSRIPAFPYGSSGASASCARSPTSPAGTARILPLAGEIPLRDRGRAPSARAAPTRGSTRSGPAACAGPPC